MLRVDYMTTGIFCEKLYFQGLGLLSLALTNYRSADFVTTRLQVNFERDYHDLKSLFPIFLVEPFWLVDYETLRQRFPGVGYMATGISSGYIKSRVFELLQTLQEVE